MPGKRIEHVEPGQVWLYKPDKLGLRRIVIDSTTAEHPEDGFAFVYAHDQRSGRKTRLRAFTLWTYYRLEIANEDGSDPACSCDPGALCTACGTCMECDGPCCDDPDVVPEIANGGDGRG